MSKKVAVIGAGIFGNSIATELSKYMNVILLEKETEIMTKASGKNHFRHHHGYHYPRSLSTALECIAGRKSFEKEYGECVLPLFPNFYSVVKEGSFVSSSEYLDFCNRAGLPHEVVNPDPELINPSRVSLTLKVAERGYDPLKLKKLCQDRLDTAGVDLRLNSDVIGGDITRVPAILLIKNGGGRAYEESFDFVVEATYAGINRVKKNLGIPRDKRQYDLMELPIVRIPREPFGVINMDGPFTSVMPFGSDGIFTVAHTKESVLESRVSRDFDGDVNSFGEIETNRERIMEASLKDFPILRHAEFLESMYITKALKANADITDERPSEITDCGNGVYSVFAGKIITAVDTAKKVANILSSKCN